MPDRADLARRYHRLLLTYPRAYRRLRAAEIVTTLVDAAPADRLRPTRREATDLLLGGLRYRFRVRRGAAVVAALWALIAGVAGAGLGGYVGWQTAPDLPSSAAARQMLAPVLPADAPAEMQRWDFVFDDDPAFTNRWEYWIGGTDEYRHGQVFVESTTAQAADNRERLAAASWRLADTEDVIAYRDGWRISITDAFTMGSDEHLIEYAVSRTMPAAVRPLAGLGLVVFGLAGWLLAVSAGRRFATLTPGRQAAALTLVAPAVAALLPATGLSAIALVLTFVDPVEPMAPWIGYSFIFARALAWLAALLLLAGAAVVATGRPAEWARVRHA